LRIIKQIIKFGEKRALITLLEKAKQGWAEEADSSKLGIIAASLDQLQADLENRQTV